MVDCEQSLILATAIVGWTKYACTRKISRRRDAKGAPKIRDYRQSQGVLIKHAHSKRKTLIGPFLDTCQQSGNSRQAAVNIHDNIDSVSVYYGWQKDYRVVWTNSEVCLKRARFGPSHSKSRSNHNPLVYCELRFHLNFNIDKGPIERNKLLSARMKYKT